MIPLPFSGFAKRNKQGILVGISHCLFDSVHVLHSRIASSLVEYPCSNGVVDCLSSTSPHVDSILRISTIRSYNRLVFSRSNKTAGSCTGTIRNLCRFFRLGALTTLSPSSSGDGNRYMGSTCFAKRLLVINNDVPSVSVKNDKSTDSGYRVN